MSVLPPGYSSIKATASKSDPLINEQFNKHVQNVCENNLSHMLIYKDTDDQVVVHGAAGILEQAQMLICSLDVHAASLKDATGKSATTEALCRMAVLTKLSVQVLEHATDDEIVEAMNMWLRGMTVLKNKRES